VRLCAPPPGQVHTNYLRYASLYQPENVWVVRFINTLVCRAYCDRLVKLSDSLQARLSVHKPMRRRTHRAPPPLATALALPCRPTRERGGAECTRGLAAVHVPRVSPVARGRLRLTCHRSRSWGGWA
jgi:hypothetical protein